MPTGIVTSPVPLTLSTGRPVAPIDRITSLDVEAEQAHIESGAITVLAQSPRKRASTTPQKAA